MEKRDDDDDDDQKVCCEWSYEEDTSCICTHVYEYQQVQGLCTDPTADSSDDDFQEGPLPESVLAQLAFG